MPYLPTGVFYRADGSVGKRGQEFGVASPAGSLRYQNAGGDNTVGGVPLTETPESPEIERAEQCTVTHTYTMEYEEARWWLTTYFYRGAIYTEEVDGFSYRYFILSARLTRERGGIGRLTITSESKSFDTPPEEFSIVPVELGVNIIKHPRYFWAFLGNGVGSPTEGYNQMVIRLLQHYFDNTTAAYRDAIVKLLKASLAGPDTGSGAEQPPGFDGNTGKYPDGAIVAGTFAAKRAALEIIQKYWRGIETPYLVGWEMTYSEYSFRPPVLNPGGYIENPISPSAWTPVPEYFYSTVYPTSPSWTIFDIMAQVNRQCYSDNGRVDGSLNISWLRKADQVDFQRTWFKTTHTWMGTPIGHWDPELYSSGRRPQSGKDFLDTA